MKTLIGMVTFGNLPFTQLAINAVRATTTSPIDFFVVVGKPGDVQTSAWLTAQGIAHVFHETNKGFAASLNDIKDYAWGAIAAHDRHMAAAFNGGNCNLFCPVPPHGFRHFSWKEFIANDAVVKAWGYDNLIIMGNDVVPYYGGVDALIEEAARGEWEWICSSQFDVKSLVARYPEAALYFTGPNLHFTAWGSSEQSGVVDFTPTARPWELHEHEAIALVERWKAAPDNVKREFVQPDCIKDVRNLCLFKRSVFEKIGYADVNFWPGGYFEDNDYCTRARKAGVKACGLQHSAYFHFWSRTIHQGEGTQPRQFQNNAAFYATKWGGGFDHETFNLPFNGQPYELNPKPPTYDGPVLPERLKIEDRSQETAIVEYWRTKS